MQYKNTLTEGRFQRRYKRFFADVIVDGQTVVAHVANTGSLRGVCDLGEVLCRISPAENPERKLRWTLEQVQTPTSWIGVNTAHANSLVWEAYTSKSVPEWGDYSEGQREVSISKATRFDMALYRGKKIRYVEVKSVSMGKDGLAQFPDAVTTRGQKHLEELMALTDRHTVCEMVFVVQRTDCGKFSPADHIDSTYGKLLRQAATEGVLISVYPVDLYADRIELNTNKKLELNF